MKEADSIPGSGHGTPAITTTYSYDPNTGELTGIDYSDTTPDIGFTYYRSGQRHTVSDAVGTRTFAYNTALQPEAETLTGLISRTITRSYDTTTVPGRNIGFSTDSNYAVTYGYDSTGRFSGISWNIGTHSDSATYTRVPDSHLLHTTSFASGGVITNSYEPNRNLRTGVKNEYSVSVISQYDYTHDNIGRRNSMTTTGDAFSISLPVPPDQKLVNTGTYTSVGYTPDNLNRYSEVNTNGSAVSPAYDDDGGLTDDGTFTYTWNGENRLITVTPKTPAVGDEQLEFLYDYMGRRARKITSSWDSAAWQTDETRFFVYDGWNLIEELDGTGITTASYVHGLDLSQSLQGAGGIGGILARIDHGADKVHVYLYDANGNVGQLLDSSDGSVAAAYEYAPFGGLTSAMGSYADVNPFRFSSKYADDVAELYYYGYRYYSPVLGRWLNRDPIGENGGVNLYSFLSNTPLAQDFLGLARIYFNSYGQEIGKEYKWWPFESKYIEGPNGNVTFCGKKFWKVWKWDQDYLSGQYDGIINENWDTQMKSFVRKQTNVIWSTPKWFIPEVMPDYLVSLNLVRANSPHRKPWDYKQHLSREQW